MCIRDRILPILINVTYLLILKSYMAGIPEALDVYKRQDDSIWGAFP